MLDLPVQTLSPDQMAQAKVVLGGLGQADPETHPLQEYPGGSSAGELTSFMVPFDQDVDRATAVAVAVLHRVFGLDDQTKLQITEE